VRRGLVLAVAVITLLSGVALVAMLSLGDGDGGDARPAGSGATVRPASEDGRDAQLRDAAWANDVERARELIDAGADVNAVDGTTQSAYLIATSEGYLELLELTLESGADVDALDSWNGTGLIRAAERGHHLVVGRLLRAGIAKDHVNRIGYQAVHEAVWFGADAADELATVQVLVAGGVELDRPSVTEGLTPLEMARERGYPTLERVLASAQRHRASGDPDAVLLAAAASGDADAVALALRDGADLEARDAAGRSALLLASAGDHVEAARVLVALGADPDAVDAQQDTPWLVTGVTGSVDMLEVLLPAGPDLGLVNRFGGVSVIPASERGHVEYVRRVVDAGIDVDHVNRLGWTALLEAVILGDGGERHQEVVRVLLAAGADASIGDRDGVTALEHAERLGHEELAEILRDRG
jgi:ankyrin repeat protein